MLLIYLLSQHQLPQLFQFKLPTICLAELSPSLLQLCQASLDITMENILDSFTVGTDRQTYGHYQE